MYLKYLASGPRPSSLAALPRWGEGRVEIVDLSPSPVLGGERGAAKELKFCPLLGNGGSGGGRKSGYTNPLESPLTKGDTRKVIPKPIFSHLQGSRRPGKVALVQPGVVKANLRHSTCVARLFKGYPI